MIVQSEGGRVALTDLQEIQGQLRKEFTLFWEHYQQRQQAHDTLLQAFPQLLQKVCVLLFCAVPEHESILIEFFSRAARHHSAAPHAGHRPA